MIICNTDIIRDIALELYVFIRNTKTACFHKLFFMVTSEGLRKVSKVLCLKAFLYLIRNLIRKQRDFYVFLTEIAISWYVHSCPGRQSL